MAVESEADVTADIKAVQADMRPLQEQRRDFTRSRLLDAASEAFARKGYVAVTVDDIVGLARCARATFYLHFNSKAAVAIALLERSTPDFVAACRSLAAQVESGVTKEGLREAFLAGSVDWRRSDGAVGMALQVAVLSEPEVGRWFADRLAQVMVELAGHFERYDAVERVHKRARYLALSHMTLTAIAVTGLHGEALSQDDVLSYLAELWADAFTP
ncbi:MAG: TetR/AcrR family transcriptional regulator [Nocardioides sp.]|uniref:TetR/AcrR family transcriptional regulator n=1 Tax=Nocardioides sp. TaxID=35761 RepID=UPI0039E49356